MSTGCFSRQAWRKLRRTAPGQTKTPGRDPMLASPPAAKTVRPRPLSLAHLSLIETPPAQLIPVAAAAGFALVDLRLAPATPTDRRYGKEDLAGLCRDLLPVLKQNGMPVWDVEIIRLNDQTLPEAYLPLMETAAVLGARRMKLVCDSEDHRRAAEILARLCDLAAPFGLTLDLEYMVFSGVKSLSSALDLVAATGRSNLQVLVDALHWMRAGDTAASLRQQTSRLGYVQLCDGPLHGPTDRQALIQEARTNRLAPGEGEFPLQQLLAAVPHCCVASLEVPLRVGREPLAHARHLFEATQSFLKRHESETIA
jgi:sugar phosphate isomerase/epimerase